MKVTAEVLVVLWTLLESQRRVRRLPRGAFSTTVHPKRCRRNPRNPLREFQDSTEFALLTPVDSRIRGIHGDLGDELEKRSPQPSQSFQRLSRAV